MQSKDITRLASHSGSWYEKHPGKLKEQLLGFMGMAQTRTFQSLKAIISP